MKKINRIISISRYDSYILAHRKYIVTYVKASIDDGSIDLFISNISYPLSYQYTGYVNILAGVEYCLSRELHVASYLYKYFGNSRLIHNDNNLGQIRDFVKVCGLDPKMNNYIDCLCKKMLTPL